MITEWRDKTIKVIQDWPISAKENAQLKKKIQICTSLHEVDQVLSKRWHYTDKIYKHNNI